IELVHTLTPGPLGLVQSESFVQALPVVPSPVMLESPKVMGASVATSPPPPPSSVPAASNRLGGWMSSSMPESLMASPLLLPLSPEQPLLTTTMSPMRAVEASRPLVPVRVMTPVLLGGSHPHRDSPLGRSQPDGDAVVP